MFKSRSKVITVSGGKGGTGKTFVSVNLAVQLARHLAPGKMNEATVSNNRVLLFDADYHLSNDHLFLGLKQPAYLDKIARNTRNLPEFITATDFGIDLISFGGDDKRINSSEVKFNERVLQELVKIEDCYDWIVVDTGAGLNQIIIKQIVFADKTVMVINPDPTSLLDAYKLVKFISLEKAKPKHILVAVNKAASMEEAVATFNKLKSTVEQFGVKMNLYYAAGFYTDKAVFDTCLVRGVPAVAAGFDSHFVHSFELLANNVQQGNLSRKINSFFENVFLPSDSP